MWSAQKYNILDMYDTTSSVRDIFEYPQDEKNRSPSELLRQAVSPMRLVSTKSKESKRSFIFNMNIIRLVGAFISKLKSSITLELEHLTPKQLAFFEDHNELIGPEKLLKHDNPFIIAFQIIYAFLLAGNVWNNTYEIVFKSLTDSHSLDILTLLCIMLHVGLFLNTQLKTLRFELVLSRRQILSYFVAEKLPFLLVMLVVIIIKLTKLDEMNLVVYEVVRAFSLFMIAEIFEIESRMKRIFSFSSDGEFILLIAKLMLKICVFLHFVSLLLNGMASMETNCGQSKTWIEHNQIVYNSNVELYIVGWYWGSTILSTVGFGDIVPANNFERGLVSFLQVICALVFGFFVNYIGSLIKVRSESTQQFEKDIRNLNRYLSKEFIPETLKSDVRSHLFNKRELENVYNPNEEKDILASISDSLKQEVVVEKNMNALQMSRLRDIFTNESLLKMALLLKKIVMMPEQVLYSQKTTDIRLWILEKGVLEDQWERKDSKLTKTISIYTPQKLENIVGWINFVAETRYRITARAKNFAILYELDRAKFIDTISSHKQDFYKFMELKEDMISMKRMFTNKCLCCDRFTHNVVTCSKIHFNHRSSRILLENEKRENKIREFQLSNKNKKCKRRNERFCWKDDINTAPQHPEESESMSPITKHNLLKPIMRKTQRCSMQGIIEGFTRRSSLVGFINPTGDPKGERKLAMKTVEVSLQGEQNCSRVTEKDVRLVSSGMFSIDRLMLDNTHYFTKWNIDRVLERIPLPKGCSRSRVRARSRRYLE